MCFENSSDIKPHGSVSNTSSIYHYFPELFISCMSLWWDNKLLKFFDRFNIRHSCSSILIKINSFDHEWLSLSSVWKLSDYCKLFWPSSSILIKHRNIDFTIFSMWISSVKNSSNNCWFLVFIVVKFMEIFWHPSSVYKKTTWIFFFI